MAIDPFVEEIDDQNESDVKGLIETDRIEAELDNVFGFDSSIMERSDVKVANKPGGKGVEKTGSMDDDEFEYYTEQLNKTDKFEFNSNNEYWRANIDRLDAPNPADVAKSRSQESIDEDRDKKARVTTDVEKYASDPNSYDYPFVDTPSEFNDEFRTSTLGGSRLLFDEIRERETEDGFFEY